MPAVTSYTEETLAEFMQTRLRATATALGWTDPTAEPYPTAVQDAERALGGPIAAQTDMAKVEAAATVEAWRAVLAERSQDYKFSTLAGTDERQQAFEQAEKMFKLALVRAGGLGLYPEETTPVSSGQPRTRSTAVRNEPVW